ncbi:MAG: hypothetical protein SFZ23_13370 [Planctomycetota bacterium]|nr:hypothetical protein [Planctomycetota bacterium]
MTSARVHSTWTIVSAVLISSTLVSIPLAGRSLLRWNQAATSLHDAQRQHASCAADAEEIRLLAAALPAITDPSSDADADTYEPLTQSVSAALRTSGLSPAVLESLSGNDAQETSKVPPFSVERRRAGVVLSKLTLPQIGQFLVEWRRAQPSWRVTSIDLALAPVQPPKNGGHLPIRATLAVQRVQLSVRSSR